MLDGQTSLGLHRRHLRQRTVAFSVIAVLAASVVSGVPWTSQSAHAVQAAQTRVVNPVPADFTPDVNNGDVFAVAQVGTQMILGGTFTSVSPANQTTPRYALARVMAFNAATGAINTSFTPTVNGKVETVVAGPHPNEVYIAGRFTEVDGVRMSIALLNTTNGSLVSTWKPATINPAGLVDSVVLAHGRLYVGGEFKTVGGQAHGGLATLGPNSGAVTSYVKLAFTGHHNFGTKCHPSPKTKCATARLGVKSLDVNPAGTKLVAIGNFTTVAGLHRDQIAMLNLGKSSATVNSKWETLAYTAECIDAAFDSYVRQVQFSPSGSYFVVVSTGGLGTNSDGTDSTCDAAARFGTSATGSNVRPAWVDYTGEDSLWSVAVTGEAVYVGGHQRWVNNNFGKNTAGQGAIARPGLAALSPSNGLPLKWNPGRDPRGDGPHALLATSAGLWMGSDTDYIGVAPDQYFRAKIAFFPLAGGEAVSATPTPRVPGRVYLAGATAPVSDRMVFREFNGSRAGAENPLSTGIPWGSFHGAFTVAGEVVYGKSDGNLYERSFDGTTFGPEVELDPFNDPTWDSVQTGSGQTYQSLPSTFSSQIPSVTSMFFTAGRLYYTLAGQSAMHWRWYEPQTGVVGAVAFNAPGSTDWSNVAGAFLSGSRLYYADATSGRLRSVAWSTTAGATGSPRFVGTATDWASRGLFVLSQTTNPTATPVAAFTATCGTSPTCTFSAQSWVDPDGGNVGYSWNFGDGTTAPVSTSTSTSHRFLTDGAHSVTLTVADTAGASSSITKSVTVAATIEKIGFVGSSTATGRSTRAHVVVPAKSRAGDALVLFDSYASTTIKTKAPKGWKLVGRTRRHSLTTAVFDKVATTHAARHRVTVKYSRAVHSTLILAVYSHTSRRPVEASAVADHSTAKKLVAPGLRRLTPGSWVLGYWTQISRRTNRWVLRHGLVRRAGAHSRRRPADDSILGDLGKSCHGTCRLGAARTKRVSAAAVRWAIALRPALR